MSIYVHIPNLYAFKANTYNSLIIQASIEAIHILSIVEWLISNIHLKREKYPIVEIDNTSLTQNIVSQSPWLLPGFLQWPSIFICQVC